MKKSISILFACIILFSCDTAIQEPVSDDMFMLKSKSISIENCENVHIQDDFQLSNMVCFDFSEMTDLLEALTDVGAFDPHSKYGDPMAWPDNEFKVTGYMGAIASPSTIAGTNGMLGSIITHMYDTNDNTAVFYHLFHLFVSKDGAFVTWDHAVQSPMHPKKYTARINNKLEVLAGTGIFKNATGKFINNGMIDFNTFTLHANVHGRICGDGIGMGY
jgi:hypothetical protein